MAENNITMIKKCFYHRSKDDWRVTLNVQTYSNLENKATYF